MADNGISKFITCFGLTLRQSEWARLTGINKATISSRLRDGWTIEDALTVSTKNPKLWIAFGSKKTLAEWAQEFGVTHTTLITRMQNQSLSLEDALNIGPREAKLYHAFGKTNSMDGWAKEFGLWPTTLIKRMRKMPLEEALTYVHHHKVGGRSLVIVYNGCEYSIGQLAEMTGIKRSVIYDRLFNLKWPIEKVINTPCRKVKNSMSFK